jgi:hypothetical protein
MTGVLLMTLALTFPQAPFDTTLSVRSDTRLEVMASAGSIDVTVWDRSAVRIVARPERGAVVSAVLEGAVLRVTARTPDAGIDLVDYAITVPRRMNLTLGRNDVDITVHGTVGSVTASITTGRIEILGGRGVLALRSWKGPIVLTGARGTVIAESTMDSVTLRDVVGDVQAKSNANHVTLTDVDSRNLRASSIGGVIQFSGPLHEDGRYTLTSHAGSVFVRTPVPVNATVAVATVNGAFASPLPYTVSERRRPTIFTARFGNGGAQVSLESFSGGLVLEELKPAGVRPM